MALWRQRGLALEQEEAGVPERGARILRLCWRAHGELLFCVLLVVVVVVAAPRGTRLVYPSRFSLSTLLRIGINVNEMRVRRTVEEQLTRSFFPPLPRAKAKNSPPPFWMTVPSWLRPIATGISGSRPSLTTSPLWIFLVYSPGYAAKKVVKHHGRVSITPPRPLATPPALDFVPELDVLFHFRPVATDSSSILVGTCLGATVILFKEDEPGKKGPTTTRIFKLELRPKHRRFNQFQDPDFCPGRPMPWCFQPSTPPDGRRLSLHIDNLPYTACRRLMRRSEGRPGWRWGK